MMNQKFSHYKKDVRHLNMIDVYRISEMYNVPPALQHALKKILVPGLRGAKTVEQDLQEAIDSIQRHLNMQKEDCEGSRPHVVEVASIPLPQVPEFKVPAPMPGPFTGTTTRRKTRD